MVILLVVKSPTGDLILNRSREENVLLEVKGIDTVVEKVLSAAEGKIVMIISKMFEQPVRSTGCLLKNYFKLLPNARYS